MASWADEFFAEWQHAWTVGTDEVMRHVSDDIEYWDATLAEPLRGRYEHRRYVDGFFAAFSEIEWSLREPVIAEVAWPSHGDAGRSGCGRSWARGPNAQDLASPASGSGQGGGPAKPAPSSAAPERAGSPG